jgi:hypothetical protein
MKNKKPFPFVIRAKKSEVRKVAAHIRKFLLNVRAAYNTKAQGVTTTPLTVGKVVERPLSVVVEVTSDDFRVNVLSDVLSDLFKGTDVSPRIPTWG